MSKLVSTVCWSRYRGEFRGIITDRNTEPVMLTKLKYPTMSYNYDDKEELIFCVKGKPFPCLVSDKLPTPMSTLLDYDMVHKLGLKMADLQCKRYSYAGHKMRVLGTVYTSVQCIMDRWPDVRHCQDESQCC